MGDSLIRRARPGDEYKISSLGEDFFKEAGWGDVTKYNNALAAESIAKMISLPEQCIIMVAEDAGEIIGMIGVMIAPIWFSGEKLAQELFWYVKPEKRGGIGWKLLHAIEQEERAAGVAIEAMTTVDKLKSLEQQLIKKGYRPSEHSFIRRL